MLEAQVLLNRVRDNKRLDDYKLEYRLDDILNHYILNADSVALLTTGVNFGIPCEWNGFKDLDDNSIQYSIIDFSNLEERIIEYLNQYNEIDELSYYISISNIVVVDGAVWFDVKFN